MVVVKVVEMVVEEFGNPFFVGFHTVIFLLW